MGKITSFDLPYNTQQSRLVMPEYGRNVHQLIEFAKTIPDRGKRQAICEQIVNLIEQLYPQSRNIEDYRDKLWHNLFHIANYDIDVDTPNGERPQPEDDRVKRPQRVPYPRGSASYRHYGNHIRAMINSAVEMEDGAIKTEFTRVIASYMKLAYGTFNREHYVSDEVIKADLEFLSAGKLAVNFDEAIENLTAKAARFVQNNVPTYNKNTRTYNRTSNGGNSNYGNGNYGNGNNGGNSYGNGGNKGSYQSRPFNNGKKKPKY